MATMLDKEMATPVPGTELPRGIGLTGRVAVSWAVAGGILLGGFLVAFMTLTGQMSANGLLISSTLLFTAGGLAGFVHGAALGYLGRGPETTRKQALAGLALAALYTIPMMAAGWVATGWIALTVGAVYKHTPMAYAGTMLGWGAGLAVLATAAVLGWKALRTAYARWSDAPLGTALVAASFAGLLVSTLAVRPTIWGIGLRLTEAGAGIFSVLVALWVVGPLVTLALALVRRLPALSLGLTGRAGPLASIGGPAASIAVGLLAGVVLGLVALAFHVAPLGVPATGAGAGPLGALVLAVSHALVDEVLLRLSLMTGAIWLLLRWHPLHRDEAAFVVGVVSALAQLALYLPGLAAVGFPSTLAAVAYAMLVVLLPALVFATLYYWRGFTTAVLADATALLALALLA